MRRRISWLVLAALALAAGALGVGHPGAAPAPTPFDHARHREQAAGLGVAVDKCETCHSIGPGAVPLAPAARGHQPCLDSRCHADFFVTSPEAAAKRPPPFADRQTAFCAECHGSMPAPWQRPPAVAALTGADRDHHVEMNHYRHTQEKLANGAAVTCTTCHLVVATTLALDAKTPGHAQCVRCHDTDDGTKRSMAACSQCHRDGARAAAARPESTVRACGSEGLAEVKARYATPASQQLPGGGVTASCFQHERVEHRFRDAARTVPIECNRCHYVVDDKTLGPARYASLADLATRSIIGIDRDQQHAACGAKGCHERDIGGKGWAPKCGLCHPNVSGF